MKKKSVKNDNFEYINLFEDGYTSYAISSKIEAQDYLKTSSGSRYRLTIEFNDKEAQIINLKAKPKTVAIKPTKSTKKLPSATKIKKQIDKTLKKQVKKVVAKKGKVKSKK